MSPLSRFFATSPRITNYIVHWSRRHRYIYVETPKAGCTTVKSVLQRIEVGSTLAPEHSVHDRAASPLGRPLDDVAAFIEAIQDPSTLKLCFVRNPYTRVVSAYLDKVVNRARHAGTGAPAATVPAIEQVLSRLARQPPNQWDIHWMPQTVLLNPARVPYHYLGRFEQLNADLREICRRLGATVSTAELLSGQRHATGADRQIAACLSSAAAALVVELYRDDFLNFDYTLTVPLS